MLLTSVSAKFSAKFKLGFLKVNFDCAFTVSNGVFVI